MFGKEVMFAGLKFPSNPRESFEIVFLQGEVAGAGGMLAGWISVPAASTI
ncbi:magnesium-translocating P-type ATPase [Acetobacter orientalis]|uniref:Magnesium-translocating P-type ATPase n=1 Tax=Acetobacter orientalis TaxID=146474 RepID=A0A2Z5ZI31_9PROT|nr:magnesium-translocating P-type ATPase [Acetobacter orientalis]